ncbi:Undecaprenyl-phosphate 4-deoxy-4-formamido-L-arabinose transferase [subsurface metagenome]
MESTLIIIPVYNEEKNILRVIEDIRKKTHHMDVLVVNDGSTDKTEYVLERSGVKVINLPYHLGYGVALQTGYKYALDKGYDFIVQMDGDGQHDPISIENLLTEVKSGDIDVAMGSRFLSNKKYRTSFPRKIGMKLFGSIASIIMGQKVTDPTSGFQALNKKAIKFYGSDVFPCDYPDADAIIMLHRVGFIVKEIPVIMHYDNRSKSMHRGLGICYYIFKMFLSIFVTLLREKSTKEEV